MYSHLGWSIFCRLLVEADVPCTNCTDFFNLSMHIVLLRLHVVVLIFDRDAD